MTVKGTSVAPTGYLTSYFGLFFPPALRQSCVYENHRPLCNHLRFFADPSHRNHTNIVFN
jgi:hypothetical protein